MPSSPKNFTDFFMPYFNLKVTYPYRLYGVKIKNPSDQKSHTWAFRIQPNLEYGRKYGTVPTFTSPLSDSGKDGVSTVGLRHIVDQLHDEHSLAHSSPTEQALKKGQIRLVLLLTEFLFFSHAWH